MRNMKKSKEIGTLDVYYPDIYLKANKVVESYRNLLAEIINYAEKEKWNPVYWYMITTSITVDLIRTILGIQANLTQEASKIWKEVVEGETDGRKR